MGERVLEIVSQPGATAIYVLVIDITTFLFEVVLTQLGNHLSFRANQSTYRLHCHHYTGFS